MDRRPVNGGAIHPNLHRFVLLNQTSCSVTLPKIETGNKNGSEPHVRAFCVNRGGHRVCGLWVFRGMSVQYLLFCLKVRDSFPPGRHYRSTLRALINQERGAASQILRHASQTERGRAAAGVVSDEVFLTWAWALARGGSGSAIGPAPLSGCASESRRALRCLFFRSSFITCDT